MTWKAGMTQKDLVTLSLRFCPNGPKPNGKAHEAPSSTQPYVPVTWR